MMSSDPEKREISIAHEDAGERLDKLLAALWPDLSRARLQMLIREGQLSLLAGEKTTPIADPAYRVKGGEHLRLVIPPGKEIELEAQAIDLDILYEDADIIVVNKPAGLVVHPAPGNPDHTLVNALLAHCGDSLAGVGGELRPGIVHRLDKDTSGVLVAAKNDAAHRGLARQFESHDIDRAYLALIWGVPMPPEGEIETNIGRNPHNRQKMAVLENRGKPALTRYRVCERFADWAALAECRLETGRTHQIRVHLAHIGHPVIGDTAYGRSRKSRLKGLPAPLADAFRAIPRQALHAARLGFDHPVSGKPLKFEAKLPYDMAKLLQHLRDFSVRTNSQ